jgi:hypothetical protein
LCLTNQAPRHEDVSGSGCVGPRFLVGTSWRWVVSFKPQPQPLYPRTKSPRYALCRRLRGLQRREIQPLRRPNRSLSLCRLQYRGSQIFCYRYSSFLTNTNFTVSQRKDWRLEHEADESSNPINCIKICTYRHHLWHRWGRFGSSATRHVVLLRTGAQSSYHQLLHQLPVTFPMYRSGKERLLDIAYRLCSVGSP